MTEGDGTSFGVDFFNIDSDFLNAINCLTGEGLIDFVNVDVTGSQAGLLQQLWDGSSGTNTHDVGTDSSNSVVNKSGEDGES